MSSIEKLDEKIAKLQRQKESLQQKVAMNLLKDLSGILGEDFSPALVVSLVTNTWSTADKKTREAWQEKSKSFQQKKPNPRSRTNLRLNEANAFEGEAAQVH